MASSVPVRSPAGPRPAVASAATRRPGPVRTANVILDFRAASTWDRGIVHAIGEAGRDHNWNTILSNSSVVPLAETVETWQADAVVTATPADTPRTGRMAEALLLVIGQDRSAEGIASICPDDSAIGRMAARHLLWGGLKDLAVFGYDHSPFARARASAFRSEITAAGGVCHDGGEFSSDRDSPDFASHQAIIRWLGGLPRPCGIFALCDNWNGPLATYCRLVGRRVPEDAALIGVDNDPLVCELVSPPLTSVAIPWRELGQAAARMIEAHLAGRPVPAECVRVKPLDVVARRSTDTLSIDDQQLAETVAWIHRNAHRPIGVEDILRAIPTYRQRLERQFRSGLGRTVMEEVRRAHIGLAKRLLAGTDLPMPDVAARSGFSNATLLGVNFRKEMGVTPREYRRRAKLGAAVDSP